MWWIWTAAISPGSRFGVLFALTALALLPPLPANGQTSTKTLYPVSPSGWLKNQDVACGIGAGYVRVGTYSGSSYPVRGYLTFDLSNTGIAANASISAVTVYYYPQVTNSISATAYHMTPLGNVSCPATWADAGAGTAFSSSFTLTGGTSTKSFSLNLAARDSFKSALGGRWTFGISSTSSNYFDFDISNNRTYLYVQYTTGSTTGSLQVNLNPSAAVTAGAQWRVDSGVWQNSGSTVTGLTLAAHTVDYKPVTGWTAPPSESVTVGASTSIPRSYSQQAGSLQVNLGPAAAVGAGAQWRVDGGTWQNSGSAVGELTLATHSVEYKALTGWAAPPSETVTVGSTTSISREYTATPSPTFEIEPYRVSDTTGTPHSSTPGAARTSFVRGESIRITLRARHAGTAAESVAWALNLALQADHATVPYDSHRSPNTDPITTLPADGQWYYRSFDWLTTTADPLGVYDLLGALRLGSNWNTALDDTEPGTNTTQFSGNAWRSAVMTLATANISGIVRSRHYPYSGIRGVTVTADGSSPAPSTTTGADGSYSLSGVAGGQRTVVATHPDYWATGSATSASRSVLVSGPVSGIDFTDFGGKGTPQATLTTSKTVVSPGESFTVTVTLANTNYFLGDVPSYLDLSFDTSRLTVATPSGSGWTVLGMYPPGSTLNAAGGTTVIATDHLISAERAGTFGNSASYAFTVVLTVKPDAVAGSITLKYRGTIADRTDPVSTGSGTRDQQGFNVFTQDVTVGAPNIYEVERYLVSDTTGALHTAQPGAARDTFGPGETIRVTLRGRHSGAASMPVTWVLNLAPQGDHTTVAYDSHRPPNVDPQSTLPNDGQWYYRSFDWTPDPTDPYGPYDLIGALRLAGTWDTVLDDTEPNPNTVDLRPQAWVPAMFTRQPPAGYVWERWTTVTWRGTVYTLSVHRSAQSASMTGRSLRNRAHTMAGIDVEPAAGLTPRDKYQLALAAENILVLKESASQYRPVPSYWLTETTPQPEVRNDSRASTCRGAASTYPFLKPYMAKAAQLDSWYYGGFDGSLFARGGLDDPEARRRLWRDLLIAQVSNTESYLADHASRELQGLEAFIGGANAALNDPVAELLRDSAAEEVTDMSSDAAAAIVDAVAAGKALAKVSAERREALATRAQRLSTAMKGVGIGVKWSNWVIAATLSRLALEADAEIKLAGLQRAVASVDNVDPEFACAVEEAIEHIGQLHESLWPAVLSAATDGRAHSMADFSEYLAEWVTRWIADRALTAAVKKFYQHLTHPTNGSPVSAGRSFLAAAPAGALLGLTSTIESLLDMTADARRISATVTLQWYLEQYLNANRPAEGMSVEDFGELRKLYELAIEVELDTAKKHVALLDGHWYSLFALDPVGMLNALRRVLGDNAEFVDAWRRHAEQWRAVRSTVSEQYGFTTAEVDYELRCLLLIACPSADQPPSPHIVIADYPRQVRVGTTVQIAVTVSNTGGDAGVSYIDISKSNSIAKWNVSPGTDLRIYSVGEPIWHADDHEGPAQFTLASLVQPRFGSGTSQSYVIRFVPESTGQHWLKVRTAMGIAAEPSVFVRDPVTGGTDQQGWFALPILIEATANNAPQVVSSHPQQQFVSASVASPPVSFAVDATDADGDIVQIGWYVDGNRVAEGANVVLDPGGIGVGSYTVMAIADDGISSTVRTWDLDIISDAVPSLSIGDVVVTEGHSGSANAVFPVVLSAVSANSVAVNFSTSDGTATSADGAYQSASGTVTLAPGTTTQTITIVVNSDTRVEAAETFFVNLGGSTNASIGDAQGVGTISNDDETTPPPDTAEKIFFSSNRAAASSGGQFHIWMASPDGSNATQVTTGDVNDLAPRLSPDGTMLAFQRLDASQCSSIWVRDLTTGHEVMVTPTDAPAGAYMSDAPSWSPDGLSLAFSRHLAASPGNCAGGAVPHSGQVWTAPILPALGTPVPASPDGGGSRLAPSWSPAGQRILYMQEAGGAGPWAIYELDIATKATTQLIPPGGDGEYDPKHSPDGTRFAWVTYRFDNGNAVIMAADLTDPANTQARVTATGGWSAPAWSPDSQKLVATENSTGDLWTMNVDGTAAGRITSGTFYDRTPWWGRLSGTASVTCTTFAISPESASAAREAGSRTVAVVGAPTGCTGGSWTASGNGSWLTVAPAAGTGSGSVTVSWTANDSGSARPASATIAGNTFAVTQAGIPSAAAPSVAHISPSGGAVAGGTLVTIAGAAFQPDASVTIGGVPATGVTIVDAETITAVTGAHAAGFADIVVVNPDAQSASLANGYLYVSAAVTMMSIGQASGAAGSTVTVPISMTALGVENSVGFSVNFDPERLSYVGAALGAGGSGASIVKNETQKTAGRVGLLVGHPAGQAFPPGPAEIVTLTFTVAANAPEGMVAIWFDGTPAAQEVSDTSANTLPAIWSSGAVSVAAGYEGDVAPRPAGDQRVATTDWVQTGRFAVGLDTTADPNEFRRADSAPRVTLGDGRLTTTDWVQAGRYAVGLDPLTAAGGLSQLPLRATAGAPTAVTETLCEVHVIEMRPAGDFVDVQVALVSSGNVNALGFTLVFDPATSAYAGALRGRDAADGPFLVNPRHAAAGRVGVQIAQPPGATWPAGERQIVVVRLRPLVPGKGIVAGFDDSVAVRSAAGAAAGELRVIFRDSQDR